MKQHWAENLACPLDGQALVCQHNQLVCSHGHSFDIARQGYVNLLAVQQKKSRDPGDSKAMITARREFLDAGFYQPLSERLNHLVDSHLEGGPSCLLDAGCGEGYYLDRLDAFFNQQRADSSVTLIGLDISKWAVLAASRRNRRIDWLVGSSNSAPLLPGSVDMILCMFGFSYFEAFRALLKPAGKVILVEAGSEHLIELREIIYPEVKKTPLPGLDEASQAGLELIDTAEQKFSIGLESRQQVQNLLAMTPHLYRASHEGKQATEKLDSLQLSVDISYRVLQAPAS